MLRSLFDALVAVTEIDLCAALVFMWVERMRPSIAEQRRIRTGMLLDVGYVYFGTLFGVATTLLGFGHAMDALGATQSHALVSLRAGTAALPFAAQLAFAVVLTDFTGYWKHRVMHTRFLWPFHAVHHSSEEVDWLSNERTHPVEIFLTSVFFLVPLVVCGAPAAVIVWTSQIRRFHSVYEHANLRIDYGRVNYLFVSPTFHRWHHSREAAWVDTNFANIFSAFDWIFGTFKLPEDAPRKGTFGVPGFPRDFVGQTLRPFRDAVTGSARSI
jgi:sterol desaturase/sphingolipid hydroxylase (fatty acid hydroxylase superfamily)